MSNLNFVSGKELLEKGLTEIPSLVEPLLPKVGLAAVTGSSDVGKTSFLRNLALSIVLKKTDFLGFQINASHHSVVYVATEDEEDATSVLLGKAYDETQSYDDYAGIRFLFETQNLLKVLDEELKVRPADCVIVDTYTDVFAGNMNMSNEVRTFLTQYKEFAQRHKCLVLFLHHTGKKTENNPPSKDNTLGSQGFESKMRVLIEIRKDYTNPMYRHLCVVKGNYLSESYKNKSFMLEFDDRLMFSNIGQRVEFDQLAKPETGGSANSSKAIFIRKALELKDKGLSHQKIADEITKSGYSVSKSTITNWINQSINKN